MPPPPPKPTSTEMMAAGRTDGRTDGWLEDQGRGRAGGQRAQVRTPHLDER